MELNPLFLERMQKLLGNEYSRYLEFVSCPPFKGLRVNTLKTDYDCISQNISAPLKASAFCRGVYHLPCDIQHLGNHPLHHSGGFYLGDPSATSAVSALDAKPGDIVLDLCASPGGKTAGIACSLMGQGFLVSNEVVSSRIQPLISNIERLGIRNVAVTNAHPEQLAEKAEGLFNKVLVDAPCSGEGMMLRDGQANANWSEKNVAACAERQRKILESAAKCVAAGGALVYSTCTFAPEENELNVAWFLDNNPDFSLEEIDADFGIPAFGHLCEREEISKARRIFPMQGGDGHFVARFRRSGEGNPRLSDAKRQKSAVFEDFWTSNFDIDIPPYNIRQDKIFICPYELDFLPNLVRGGVFAGYIKGNRFEPAHSLYSAFGIAAKSKIDFEVSDPLLADFLKGLEIPCDKAGYTAVLVCGMPLSFGKASGGRLKNHYPKGLRAL